MDSATGRIKPRINFGGTSLFLQLVCGVLQSWLKPPQQGRRKTALLFPEIRQYWFPRQGVIWHDSFPIHPASRLTFLLAGSKQSSSPAVAWIHPFPRQQADGPGTLGSLTKKQMQAKDASMGRRKLLHCYLLLLYNRVKDKGRKTDRGKAFLGAKSFFKH